MAQRKKTATKKTAKATVKRSVPKKTNENSFWQVKFTVNTVYWLAIGIAVVSAALFSYSTNLKVNEIYDQIDIQNAQEY